MYHRVSVCIRVISQEVLEVPVLVVRHDQTRKSLFKKQSIEWYDIWMMKF